MKKLLLATIVALALVMQLTQEYRFYAKETENLWLNDYSWIMQHLEYPSGPAQLLTSAFTQFYGLPGIGAVGSALLFGLMLAVGAKMFRLLKIRKIYTSWLLLPITFMMLCHENSFFNLNGNTATVLALASAWLYILTGIFIDIRFHDQKKRLTVSAVWAIMLTSASYWLAGSATIVMVAIAIVYELLWRHNFASLSAVAVAIVASVWLWVGHSPIADIRFALTPLLYYEWPSTFFFPLYAWISTLLIILAGHFLSTRKEDDDTFSKGDTILLAISILAISFIFGNLFMATHNADVYQSRKDEWMARNQDWKGIIESHEGSKKPTPFMSYLNLALAHEGILCERIMKFHPYIVNGKGVIIMSQSEQSYEAQKLQSLFCRTIGGPMICNAQKAALEANLLTAGNTDPEELKTLALTSYVFDAPDVAQKYLRRLSLTTLHGKWAREMLANPASLMQEAEQIRKTLPQTDIFYFKTQISKMLSLAVEQNPDNQIASQFLEAYKMVAKGVMTTKGNESEPIFQ